MDVFERYFERNEVCFQPVFDNHPEVIVIIPVLNDREVFATLDSLYRCTTNEGDAGVIVLVNHGENANGQLKGENWKLTEELQKFVKGKYFEKPRISVYIGTAFDMPAKFAGVGLARKLAMDAAAAYFYRKGKRNCPIVSLDADTYVERNYLDEVIRIFRQQAVAGISIAYAHRLEECEGPVLEAIVKYELYLRYYQLALKYTGHPYAYHCIGSAFAVRANDYVAQGGMNKRQAGEDFYFLQKLMTTGRYVELGTTRVYPSARFSDRTPFGTGKAVKGIVENGGMYFTYHLGAFSQLKVFFQGIGGLYRSGEKEIRDYFNQQPAGLQAYLYGNGFVEIVEEVNANCGSEKQFIKRFFDRFNAFRVLKYLNEVHEKLYQKRDIVEEVKALAEVYCWTLPQDPLGMLEELRGNKMY